MLHQLRAFAEWLLRQLRLWYWFVRRPEKFFLWCRFHTDGFVIEARSRRAALAAWYRWAIYQSYRRFLRRHRQSQFGKRHPRFLRFQFYLENPTEFLVRSIPHLRRALTVLQHRGWPEVAASIQRHLVLWVTALLLGLVLTILHFVHPWRAWLRDLQPVVDALRSWFPATWRLWLRHTTPRLWIPLIVVAVVMLLIFPIAVAVRSAMRRRRQRAEQLFSGRHAHEEFLRSVRDLGRTVKEEGFVVEVLSKDFFLLRFQEALDTLLAQILEDRQQRFWPLLRETPTLHAMLLLAAFPCGSHPAFRNFLIGYIQRYRAERGTVPEGRQLIEVYTRWLKVEPTEQPLVARLILARDLWYVRQNFANPEWLAKYSRSAS